MKLRKFTSILLLISLLLLLAAPIYATETENDSEKETELSDDSFFKTPVGAALLVERTTGEVLFSLNADEQKYPASLTKIMTCMLALNYGDKDSIVTVSESALAGFEIGAAMAEDHLQVGEQIRMEDLLYYMMLESANESCVVIAEHISGSEEAFVELMNQTAADLGCTGTHFANPHGLHDEDHYSTANDLLKITEKALENELFRTITSSAIYEMPATNMREGQLLYSTNKLINKNLANNSFYYSKASGIKTGFTTPAGRCLISTANDGNMELLGIILKAETMPDENGNYWERSFPESINMFEWGFERFEISTVMSTLYPVAEIPVNMSAGAGVVALAPKQEVRTLVEADYKADDLVLDIKLNAESVDAPIEAGQVLGSVTVSYHDKVLGTSELAAITSVARSEVTHQVSNTEKYATNNWWKWVVGILLSIAGLIVIGFVVLYYYRRQQRKRKIAARRRALELQRRRREWNLPED